MCCEKHTGPAAATSSASPVPLDATHIGPSPGAATSVSLKSIGALQGVGKIPVGETIGLLGLTTIKVTWQKAKSAKGEVKFGPRLEKATSRSIVDVASEGEQRCIALAAFLAELSQAAHQSTLVFDDPVSSLDQRHRLKIAERLVEESKTRQVIVFTHDILFTHDLDAAADLAGLPAKLLSLEWDNNRPGKVIDGLSWDCSKPPARLAELRTIQTQIAKTWNSVPNASNVAQMRDAYSKLRATVEGVIEHTVLGGVVRRFASQIVSGHLKRLVGISQAEVDEAERILKRCHEATQAHYSAPGKHASIPNPTDLLADIDATDALRKLALSRY